MQACGKVNKMRALVNVVCSTHDGRRARDTMMMMVYLARSVHCFTSSCILLRPIWGVGSPPFLFGQHNSFVQVYTKECWKAEILCWRKQVSSCNIMTNQDNKECLQIDEEMTVSSYMV